MRRKELKTVLVYRNLRHGWNTRPLYSILHNGKVIARRHRVLLQDCKFIVREGGRQRVLDTGRKNVHAFVKGKLVDSHGCFGIDANGKDLPVHVHYNPYKMNCFKTDEGLKINSADGVLLNENGISACYTVIER